MRVKPTWGTSIGNCTDPRLFKISNSYTKENIIDYGGCDLSETYGEPYHWTETTEHYSDCGRCKNCVKRYGKNNKIKRGRK